MQDGLFQGIPLSYDKRFIKILQKWEETTCKATSGDSSPKKARDTPKSTEKPDDVTRVDSKEEKKEIIEEIGD